MHLSFLESTRVLASVREHEVSITVEFIVLELSKIDSVVFILLSGAVSFLSRRLFGLFISLSSISILVGLLFCDCQLS